MSAKHSGRSRQPFGLIDFLWRLLGALILVLVTFNPSGFSYLHWLREAFSGEGLHALHFLAGVILLAGWSIFVVATSRSLGFLGTLLGVALIGTAIWSLVEMGVLRVGSATAVTWLVLVATGILLAVGLSWSHVWRRLSGQLEVDEAGD